VGPYGGGALEPQQGQQQQSVVVVNPGASNVFVQPTPYVNFTGYIVLSCIVFWCFGCLFGLIAFILASKCTSTEKAKGFGCARIISLFNIEQTCGWLAQT
jgi:hypothetical protein